MKQLLAVARLDIQRLSFPLLACALIAGLTPAFSSGLGSPARVDAVLAVAFFLVGAVAGGTFGYDFAEGRGSFFFARPLSAATLVAGRILSALVLAAGTFVAVMAAHWISTSDAAAFELFVLRRGHFDALAIAWTMGLYVGLAAATQARNEDGPRNLRSVAAVLLRVVAILSLTILVFGLFADLVFRVYASQGPARLFFGSWIWGAFAASVAGIVLGRTDRLRIARFQNAVMAAVSIVTSVSVCVAWYWALNPGPASIRTVIDVLGSPDGRFAYVRARVDRGDPATYRPTFIVDLVSGATRLLKVDPYQGPWTSSDGNVMVWAEATPVFFRPIIRKLGGGSHYRMQIGDQSPVPLEVPRSMQGLFIPGPDFLTSSVLSIMPSPDGDIYAIQSSREFRFMSRARGEFPRVDLPKDAWAEWGGLHFLPDGRVRTGTGSTPGAIVDILPESGRAAVVAAFPEGNIASVRFNRTATQALITTRTSPISKVTPGDAASRMKQARTGSAFLITFDQPGVSGAIRPLVTDAQMPWSLFLDDGRIVTSVNDGKRASLLISSAEGVLQKSIVLAERSTWAASEMFPGVVSVTRGTNGPNELDLIDCSTGATVRTLRGFRPAVSPYPGARNWNAPPAGTPGARLVVSRDGSLYELPSLQAEPRLLLPRPRS